MFGFPNSTQHPFMLMCLALSGSLCPHRSSSERAICKSANLQTQSAGCHSKKHLCNPSMKQQPLLFHKLINHNFDTHFKLKTISPNGHLLWPSPLRQKCATQSTFTNTPSWSVCVCVFFDEPKFGHQKQLKIIGHQKVNFITASKKKWKKKWEKDLSNFLNCWLGLCMCIYKYIFVNIPWKSKDHWKNRFSPKTILILIIPNWGLWSK